MKKEAKPRLIVGISGASGAPIAVELLRALQKQKVETHLVVTAGGESTLAAECGMTLAQVQQLADQCHAADNISASIASGSFCTMGMVIVPCSMKTVAGIACGYSDNLLLRAADVVLKERRKLILVPRECPLGNIHLRNLLTLNELGTIIIPPMLAYYNHPQSIEDSTCHMVGKLMDCLELDYEPYQRWNG